MVADRALAGALEASLKLFWRESLTDSALPAVELDVSVTMARKSKPGVTSAPAPRHTAVARRSAYATWLRRTELILRSDLPE